MAIAWHCAGPTTVQVRLNPASGDLVTLGITSNDDLVSMNVEELNRNFTRNDLGDMTAESVLTGSAAEVSATFEYWDEAVWAQILGRTRRGTTDGSNEGFFAEVGRLMVGDRAANSSVFTLKVLTTKVGEKSYEMKYVRIVGHRTPEIGSTMKRLVVVFEVLPDPVTGRFYTPTVNT